MASLYKNRFRRIFILFFLGTLLVLTIPRVFDFWQKKKDLGVGEIIPKHISAEEVVAQINTYRTENKMTALKRNDQLDKAATARIEVIRSRDDFSGEITGVTLENSVKNNKYNFSALGELVADGVTGESNLIEFWSDEDERKILDDKVYRDIGVAVVKEGLTDRIEVILGRLASAPVERIGTGGYPRVAWGGPELWEAVNKRRVEMGVGPLSKRDELCTLASIRLNQLLEMGKLDGHAGFEPTLNREDLKWIREKYNLSEFLIVGYLTPQEAVAGWEHTLGHRGLLAGGEYVWGCVYAQNTFGVAIAAY